MIKKYFIFLSLVLIFSCYSCTGVQEYVFPSLSDEEVAAPPALEEVPQAVEELSQANTQEIPPSQYAPPPSIAPTQAVNDTGPTGTFVGGKINQFRADLTSIQNAISSHNNDFLRFKDLVDEQTSVYQDCQVQ